MPATEYEVPQHVFDAFMADQLDRQSIEMNFAPIRERPCAYISTAPVREHWYNQAQTDRAVQLLRQARETHRRATQTERERAVHFLVETVVETHAWEELEIH